MHVVGFLLCVGRYTVYAASEVVRRIGPMSQDNTSLLNTAQYTPKLPLSKPEMPMMSRVVCCACLWRLLALRVKEDRLRSTRSPANLDNGVRAPDVQWRSD